MPRASRAAMAEDWKPLSSAPKDGRWLLLADMIDGDLTDVCEGRWNGGEWETVAPAGEFIPTHWIDVPAKG